MTATASDIETKAQMLGDLVAKEIGKPVRVTHDSDDHGPWRWRVVVSLPKYTMFTSYSLRKLEQSMKERLDDKYLNIVVSLGLDDLIDFTVYVD